MKWHRAMDGVFSQLYILINLLIHYGIVVLFCSQILITTIVAMIIIILGKVSDTARMQTARSD